jgi:ABC-2 type transport system permease protein
LTALLIAANDLRRRLRDRSVIVTVFLAPVALATIVGLAFGGSGSEPPTGIRIAVADHADSPATAALADTVVRWSQPGPGIAIVRAPSVPQALSDLSEGRLSAVVELPPRYLERKALRFPSVIAGRDNPLAGSIAYAIAQALHDVAGTGRIASARAPEGLNPAAVASALSAEPPIALREVGTTTSQSLMGYFGPAVAMVFLFFGIGVGARSVLSERQIGTLARLQAAPVRFSRVLLGKLLAMTAMSILSVAVVWGTTTWVLGASWGDPLGVVVLSLALIAAMGAIALFITVIARTEQQADAATAGVGFTLALFGGSFFPPGSLPRFFETLSLATPNGWGLQGFGALAIDRKGPDAVVGPVIALLVITAAFGIVAVARFRRTVTLT